jgi:predicted enzyme related to lactoylglutathione lyase
MRPLLKTLLIAVAALFAAMPAIAAETPPGVAVAEARTIPQVKSFGWYNYFVPRADEGVAAFYTDVLGLPLIRSVKGGDHPNDFFWAGEAVIFEIIYEGQKGPAEPTESDPDTAPLVAVYRVHDLPGIIARLTAKGAKVSAIRAVANGHEAFVTDPRGYLTGLREISETSKAAADIEARRRWKRGEAFNPGSRPMPPGFQDMSWIVRRVKDVPAMTAFYRDALGLKVIGTANGRALLDMGDATTLELAPGGRVSPPPENRTQLQATIIFRVAAMQKLRQKLVDGGGAVVHNLIQWDRGELSYVADPEGNLIGIEEKYEPSRINQAGPLPSLTEDIEADRRWVEHIAEGR